MKTFSQPNSSQETATRSCIIFAVLLIGTLIGDLAKAGEADEGFQYNVLFKPSPAQLSAEDRGRVMIYDGLDNAVVEHALDKQFNRIEHMMFVRTRHSTSENDDEYIVEDDGC